MTKRENVLSLYRRKGYEKAPVKFVLCPSLVDEYVRQTGDKECKVDEYFDFDVRTIYAPGFENKSDDIYSKYYKEELAAGTIYDDYGVAHEPGGEDTEHFTRMHHPLQSITTLDELKSYPFPSPDLSKLPEIKKTIDELHTNGYAVSGCYEATIWERAWYIRSMPELMCDMMTDDDKANYLFDKITEDSIVQCSALVEAGVDILQVGDDIGMQSTIMMGVDMYVEWIKPRLKKVIDAVKEINPDVLIQYHSCGFIVPYIDHLVEAGIDILNPVQPESMDFKELYNKYNDVLSFNGTVGTQTTMPFGTPDDVYAKVHENLDLVGPNGGLFCAPTHVLEPEVPWENILAYVEACREYNPNK